jgi:ribonuclease BN (tRNA processing enzyme)
MRVTTSALTSIAVISIALPLLTTQAPASHRAKTELILLGTGTPVPDPEAWGPASAVVSGGRLFLVDAGSGVTRRLAAAGFPRVHEVAALFLTHLHSDHTLGYPDLVFTTWIMGRRGPLIVYGPPGLKSMTEHLMQAWSADIDERVRGLERETRDWVRVEVHEAAPGVVYDRDGVRVKAIAVQHGDWPAFAFRFDTPDRSITFSGDTAPVAALVDAARGTDVLVHEVYDSKRVKPEDRPGGQYWPEYLKRYHTSDVELGRLASQVRPGLLVLIHVLRLGGTDDEILAGIRSGGYTGRVVFGRDLDRF